MRLLTPIAEDGALEPGAPHDGIEEGRSPQRSATFARSMALVASPVETGAGR